MSHNRSATCESKRSFGVKKTALNPKGGYAVRGF
jgi:hypothetical protein